MELQEGAETPEPPPGKMNRTAFKLFVKRRSGGAMPSIFGVRSKVRPPSRSHTQEGLAEVAAAPAREAAPGGSDEPPAPRPQGFFSLLRKGGRGEPAPPPPGAKQRRGGGLRGLLSGMQRWRRGPDTAAPGEPPAPPPPPREPSPERAPPEEPPEPEDDESPLSSLHIEDILQEAAGRSESPGAPDEEAAPPPPPAPRPLAPAERTAGLLFADAASLKSFDSLTGCGDITADPGEEERPGVAGPAPGEPAPPQPAPAQEPPPTLLTYQGGGEEMASPEGVEEDFWGEAPASPPHQTGEVDPSTHQGGVTMPASPQVPRDTVHRQQEGTVPRETVHQIQGDTMPSETTGQIQGETVPRETARYVQGHTVPRDTAHQIHGETVPLETARQLQLQTVPRDTTRHVQAETVARDAARHVQGETVARDAARHVQKGNVFRDTTRYVDNLPRETACHQQEEAVPRDIACHQQEEAVPRDIARHQQEEAVPRDIARHLQEETVAMDTVFQPQEDTMPTDRSYQLQEDTVPMDIPQEQSMPSTYHLQEDTFPRGTAFQSQDTKSWDSLQEDTMPCGTALQPHGNSIPIDSAFDLQADTMPRDSCSGEALYDLSADPKLHLAELQSSEETACVAFTKPLSPVTATCPLKSATGGGTKDSKIPISIRHLPVHPPSHVTDTCTSPQPPPSKSEIPRTKIPVSKVLVRRVSNKVLTGTAYKTSSFLDNAKK